MPRVFTDEFNQVRAKAFSLGISAEEMLRESVQALTKKDRSLAESVMARRPLLSRDMETLHEELFTVIAMHQPLPRDTAEITCTLCLTMSMERVARYAEEIAAVAAACPPGGLQEWVFPLCAIPQMATETCAMVHDSLDAFQSSSPDPISRHTIRNDEIQAMGARATRAGFERMAKEPREIRTIERALQVIRALEASAENSGMIAEKLHISLTGKCLEKPLKTSRSL